MERWPMDYDTLSKGDTISPDRIEHLTGKKRGTTAYQLASLALSERIQKELESRGKVWTVVIRKDAIRILTDIEASEHNHREQVSLRARQCKRFRLLSAVEVAALDGEQKRDHENRLMVNSRYMQAMLAAKKTIRLPNHERNVPKQLPETN